MGTVNDAQAQNIRSQSVGVAGATNSIVAAVTGKKIRVFSALMSSIDAKTVQWTDGVGGAALTGAVPCAASGGYVLPFNPAGWFETSIGTALGLSLGAATAVAGVIDYALV